MSRESSLAYRYITRSEIAPPKHRGRYVVMNHVGFVAGLASGFWFVTYQPHAPREPVELTAFRVGYAMTFWDDERGSAVGWRFSFGASFIPAILFITGLPFMHESYVDRTTSAIAILLTLRSDPVGSSNTAEPTTPSRP